VGGAVSKIGDKVGGGIGGRKEEGEGSGGWVFNNSCCVHAPDDGLNDK
jgi:hypothetical protein